MKPSAIIGILIAILVIIGLGMVFFSGSATPTISSVVIQRPNIVVTGSNLSKVEVWAIPTGTGVTESNYQMLGLAQKSNEDSAGVQTWTLAIPAEPLSISEIFAKGFGSDSTEIKSASAAQIGATELFNALWATSTSATSTSATTTSNTASSSPSY